MMSSQQEQAENVVLDDNAETTTTMKNVSCCGWIRSELSCDCCCSCSPSKTSTTPMFGLVDPNGKHIDIERSFGMNGTGSSIATKFCLLALSVVTLIYGWSNNDHPYWFMAYLTQWTLVMTIIYFACSLALSTMKMKKSSNNTIVSNSSSSSSSSAPNKVSAFQWTLIKIMWGLFSIVSAAGGAVVLVYWAAVYDYKSRGFPKYYSIMSHGIIFLLALTDAFVLNKIPLRLNHYMIVLCYGLTFIAWSIVAAATNIDNPNTDSDENTEALYTILDWDNSPTAAAIVGFGVNFVILPFFIIVFWIVSVTCCRKYLEDKEEQCFDCTDGSERHDTASVGETDDIIDVEAVQDVEVIEAKPY